MDNMPELRVPNIIPINDHVWLLDDNHAATCYVVAGTKQALKRRKKFLATHQFFTTGADWNRVYEEQGVE